MAGLVRVWFPGFDLIFRLALSVLPFAIVLNVLHPYLRTHWLWARIVPMFAVHCALIAMFLSYIRQVNMWIWGMVVLAETVLIGFGMIPGLPADWDG